MRTLFFGTPEIAVPALEALHETTTVVGVVCQPDRPAGRGLELRPPAIKRRALELGLDVHQPRKVKTGNLDEWIRDRDVEVALVMAYGRIIPPKVLAAPRKGFINLHASLLPRYRGAAPINWALVRGEQQTGISLMQMDEGCDTGPVYSMHAIRVEPDETAGTLAERLAALAAEVVRADLGRALSGELPPVAQDDAEASSARIIKKEDGRIDWTKPAQEVHDHARGMTPWPGAFCFVGGKRFKVLSTRRAEPSGQLGEPGTVLTVGRAGAEVACGSGSLLVLRGQVEGRKALDASQLAAGRVLAEGTVLEGVAPAAPA
ncbi:MAG: methionyl-tRNA formyltransferase [Deltaproteobacteria bacterium]|jgi:methionyl-tRNA formyltransferase|nr:methionyl-tRNA formyltransferase [Deltaproteobacteria bacterium]MBW2531682.1 methionyl-tRNA formyltransferase [Deltaproteobacteria bacterium]